jgi:hypothetical protein
MMPASLIYFAREQKDVINTRIAYEDLKIPLDIKIFGT